MRSIGVAAHCDQLGPGIERRIIGLRILIPPAGVLGTEQQRRGAAEDRIAARHAGNAQTAQRQGSAGDIPSTVASPPARSRVEVSS
jgi:hypothetical protein